MAGTDFSEIFDNFMLQVSDYRLTNLFNISQTDFNTYLSGWLIQVIPQFVPCDQLLTYTGTTFDNTLTQKNINILVLLMKKVWLEKELENILQMNNFVQDRDFHTFSQANNMNAKRERLITLKEEISQTLVDYGLGVNNWADWYNQSFFVP